MGFQDEDGTLNWDISKQSLLKQYSRKQSSSSECRSILMLPAFICWILSLYAFFTGSLPI